MGTTEIKPSVIMKRRFRKQKSSKLSLKSFARKLADAGDPVAKAWFFNKSLQRDVEAKELRWNNKGARILMERSATKSARRKKSQGKGTKAPTAAATA